MDHQWDWFYRQCGQLVADKRKHSKLTQTALAVKLNMSRASVANIEAGKQRMQLHLLFQISKLLVVSPYDLIPASAAVNASQGSNETPPVRLGDELLIKQLIERQATVSR